MSFNNLAMTWKISILLGVLGIISIGGALIASLQMGAAQAQYEYVITGPQMAALKLTRALRSSYRAAAAIYENITVTEIEATRLAKERMAKESDLVTKNLVEAEALAPTFAADIANLRNKYTSAMSITCAETVRLADAAKTAEDSAAAAASMRGGCSGRLDEFSADAQALASKVVAYADQVSKDTSQSVSQKNMMVVASISLATLVILGAAVLLVRGGIVRPIRGMVGTMDGLGKGVLDRPVDGTTRRDEIGELAKGLEVLRVQLQEAERVRTANAGREEIERQRLENRERLARSFVTNMQTLASGFAQSSNEVAGSARNLSATAEQTSRQAQAVAAAAEQAASNVQTVAASSEELAASVREISSRVFHSAEVADVAFREAQASNARIAELSKAADAIGDVVSLIKGIADQTNLLALNATIESARAGEAGKGFQVVATEVKELAAQTARATDEISNKVTEIQRATDGTVISMAEIIRVVGDIKTISTTIAGAVEEQGAATGEIAQNCQQAATGTQQVTENISGVGRAAEMTGSASGLLLGLSEGLSRQAGDLRQEVETFVTELQAA